MAWFKAFVSSFLIFLFLVSVVGSGIIVEPILITSNANAATITKLVPDPLYLLPFSSGELLLTISEPAEPGGQLVSLTAVGDLVSVPASIVVPQGETTALISVTSMGILGETSVMATIGFSDASVRIIITERIPPKLKTGVLLLLLLD